MSRMQVIAFIGIACCVAATMQGCRVGDLRAFQLQTNTGWPIEGRIVDNYDAVDIYADNAMTVQSGGAVAFRTRELTDGTLSMQLSLKAGNAITIQTRSTPHSDSVLADPGIAITIRNNAVVVEQAVPRVSKPVSITPDEPFIVEIVNEGRWIDVTVACTHIGRFFTARPTTEWVTLRSNDQAAFTLVDPTFRPLVAEQ